MLLILYNINPHMTVLNNVLKDEDAKRDVALHKDANTMDRTSEQCGSFKEHWNKKDTFAYVQETNFLEQNEEGEFEEFDTHRTQYVTSNKLV